MRIRERISIGRGAAQAGFTLIEMMISVTLGLIIMGALLTVVLSSSSTGRTRDRASEVQVNGRYALEQIKTNLMHSGFLGVTSLFFPDQALSAGSPAINVANACDNATVGKQSMRIWGANDTNPFAATCIPAANYLGGDVLVVRHLNPVQATAPFDTKLVYYHSAYEGGQPFVGPTVPDFTPFNRATPYLDYLVEEVVYYVSPYTTSAAESPKVPALYRLRLGSGPAMVPELVATGVENLQVRYGVFQTDDTVRYLSANEMAVADWDLVRSVQVWLLVRASGIDQGYKNNTAYTMGAQTVTVNDNYRRLLLSAVVQLRN
jgi:type IV pilus assembly protein PilW